MISVILKKSFIQIKRDRVMLILTLILAPFFIFLYKLIFLEGMSLYEVALIGNSKMSSYIEDTNYPGGGELFRVVETDNYYEALDLLYKHKIKLIVIFKSKRSVEIYGDYSDPYFILSTTLIEKTIDDYYMKLLGLPRGIEVKRIPIGNSKNKDEFESYIPGIIIFSIVVQLYLFTMLLLKEKESGVYLRYKLTRVNASSYIIGHTLGFYSISLLSIGLTLITAFSLGFSSINPVKEFFILLLTALLLNLSVIGIAFIISALSNTLIHGLLLTTFPFMITIFFSGSLYPFPGLQIFKIIPATHGVSILNKVLTYGVGFIAIIPELIYIVVLSVITFLAGVFILIRTSLKSSAFN